MSSRSVSSAKLSGEHLKHNFCGTAVRATVAKILPRILKQRSSPHCRFSVAWGNARQCLRISSTCIGAHSVAPGADQHGGLEAYITHMQRAIRIARLLDGISFMRRAP